MFVYFECPCVQDPGRPRLRYFLREPRRHASPATWSSQTSQGSDQNVYSQTNSRHQLVSWYLLVDILFFPQAELIDLECQLLSLQPVFRIRIRGFVRIRNIWPDLDPFQTIRIRIRVAPKTYQNHEKYCPKKYYLHEEKKILGV